VKTPRIERQQAEGKQVAFRVDAAFAKPEIWEALEERVVLHSTEREPVPAAGKAQPRTKDALHELLALAGSWGQEVGSRKELERRDNRHKKYCFIAHKTSLLTSRLRECWL
jgi:hypothetical protein